MSDRETPANSIFPKARTPLEKLAGAVLLLSLVALVAFGTFKVTRAQSQRIVCVSNQRALGESVTVYRLTHAAVFPTDLESLARYESGQSEDASVRCVTDGRAYLYDPATGAIRCPNHPAW